jgi:hypothetical protein
MYTLPPLVRPVYILDNRRLSAFVSFDGWVRQNCPYGSANHWQEANDKLRIEEKDMSLTDPRND